MRSNTILLAGSAATASAATLASVCTSSHVNSALSGIASINGITIDTTSATANAVYNETNTDQTFYPNNIVSYCNVTFSYTHNGLDDTVILGYTLPAPSEYQNRFLATGGGGFAINSGTTSSATMYGAVAGYTDGGFGSFDTQFDAVNLLANGTINWPSVYMFGYQGIQEMTLIGKQFTQQFYGSTNGTKLWSYYQGCSEGGREGWSQAQRAASEYDGIIAGAPAFRYGQQQVNHLFANVVEQTQDYYPPSCELDAIVEATVKYCDPLDGLTDGVVARSDLCQLNFNMSSIVGTAYSCDATAATGYTAASPAQNGTVTAAGIKLVQTIVDGLHDSEGRRVYISYQIGSNFTDAVTTYDSTTQTWDLTITSLGGEWVARFIELVEESNLPNLNNVTFDTLKEWMITGMERYGDSLQTTLPDLTPLQTGGGKILHFHGEQDFSIPTGSSVHYWNSVRETMYPTQSYNDSAASLNEWYRLYLIPGAGHCDYNALQPNGPFPQTNLAVMIDWVENDVVPTTLNGTVMAGENKGDNGQICAWPLRPLYSNSTLSCVYDQAGIDTFNYTFDAYPLPLY